MATDGSVRSRLQVVQGNGSCVTSKACSVSLHWAHNEAQGGRDERKCLEQRGQGACWRAHGNRRKCQEQIAGSPGQRSGGSSVVSPSSTETPSPRPSQLLLCT